MPQYPLNGLQAVKKAISTATQPRATYTARYLTHFIVFVPEEIRAYMKSIQALIDHIRFSIAFVNVNILLLETGWHCYLF